MELVYLWVENYKNIQKQGFNFSPRFECKFHDKYDENGELEANCKLIIDENDDYIENFFGDNINVTAIVGKNGSGKSSVLEVFEKLISSHKIYMKKKYLLIYYLNGEHKAFANIKFKCNINIFKYALSDFSGFMSFVSQLPYPIYDRERYHLSSVTHDGNYGDYKTVTFETNKILKMIAYIFRNNIFIENNLFNFIPISLKLTVVHELEIIIDSEDEIKKFYLNRDDYEDKEYIYDDTDDILANAQAGVEFINPDEDHIFENYLKNLVLINKLQDAFFFSSYQLIVGEELNNIEKLTNFLKDEQVKYNCDFEIFKSFLGKKILIKELSEIDIELYFDTYYELLNFDFIDKNNRHLYDLSNGELSIFSLLLNLIVKAKATSSSNIFILDELEISLHPSWQKKILSVLITTLKKINQKMHLLFITHSPFLLSDIPKQNIIFLDKDENGKCKVLKHNQVLDKKETFGANIHTLLSDSFFMEDGLMGEFAKGKIDEVIDYLNGKDTKIKNDDEAQKLVNIIGEPIVKNQLQRMLDSKRLKKVDEIDTIKKSMKEMQKRLDELEK